MRLIIILSVLFSFLSAGIYDNRKYDMYFMKEYRNYFYMYKDFYNWKIIKAQSIQESRLKPNARSYVGAQGLMQIMPKTELELKKDLKISGSAWDPATAIKMGVYYDKKMFNMWKSKRTMEDRYKLMFASYNAGAGHLFKAQKICLKTMDKFYIPRHIVSCNEHYAIEAFLHEVTGHHSNETKTYVKRIFMYYDKLLAF